LKKPTDLQARLREGFSKRLIYTLKAKGYTSSRAFSGASAKTLAAALGCSTTMARRYLSAESLPENKTMEKLSNWLQVDIWWLLYGNKEQSNLFQFDKALLKEILLQTSLILIHNHQNWSTMLDDILGIYENAAELPGTLAEKKETIQLMVDFLKKKFK
jgi:transcriptional regulator with XRE-family HTH domain